jgi:hypothetical protein
MQKREQLHVTRHQHPRISLPKNRGARRKIAAVRFGICCLGASEIIDDVGSSAERFCVLSWQYRSLSGMHAFNPTYMPNNRRFSLLSFPIAAVPSRCGSHRVSRNSADR